MDTKHLGIWTQAKELVYVWCCLQSSLVPSPPQYLPSMTDRWHLTSLVLSIPYDGVWASTAAGCTWLTLDLCQAGVLFLGLGLALELGLGLFFSLGGNVLLDAAATSVSRDSITDVTAYFQ